MVKALTLKAFSFLSFGENFVFDFAPLDILSRVNGLKRKPKKQEASIYLLQSILQFLRFYWHEIYMSIQGELKNSLKNLIGLVLSHDHDGLLVLVA